MCKKTKIKLFRLMIELTAAAMFASLLGRAIPIK
jgi:hypothetical protein